MAEKERHSEGYGSQRWIVKEEVRVKAGVVLPQALFTPRKLKRIAPSLISGIATSTASSPFTSTISSFPAASAVSTTLPLTLPLALPLLVSTPIVTCGSNSEANAESISLQAKPNKIRKVNCDENLKSTECDNSVKICDPTTVNQIKIAGLSSPSVVAVTKSLGTQMISIDGKNDAVDRSTSPVNISILQSPIKSKSSVINKTPKSSKALSSHINSISINNNNNNNNQNKSNSSSNSNSSSINSNGNNSSVKNSSLFKFFVSTPAALPSSQPEPEQKKTEIPEIDPKSPIQVPTQTSDLNKVANKAEIIILDNEDSSI